MANVQKQFETFHETIKLRRFKHEQHLRDKRTAVRNRLKTRLPEVFEAHGEECPAFDFEDQGSYQMGTGTKPLNGDYDIDQGLYFKVGTADYPDPVVLKERVEEALIGHTKDVRIRRSCVTVFYEESEEPLYHVDIAVYSDPSSNDDGKGRLAKGRKNSDSENRKWEVSDPAGLWDAICDRFEGNDRAQFRRIVRYLKRWRHEKFTGTGNAAPLGIGLTIATYDDLQPTYFDLVAGAADDLGALQSLVQAVLARFVPVYRHEQKIFVRRLVVKLPVEPWSDLFEQMYDSQMAALEDKLKTLRDALDGAVADVDPVDACTRLEKVFGKDFPIPEPEDTGKKHMPAIASHSHSG